MKSKTGKEKQKMASSLRILFKFELIVAEMQSVVIDMKKRGVDKTLIDKAIERIDSLLEVYKTYDTLYFGAYYEREKNAKLSKEIQDLRSKLLDKQSEIEKLLKSMEWK